MVALGEGEVDVPRVLAALTQPVDGVIELDECATDPLDAARRGRVYLESLSG
jgi:sugar phosphate isomerase/epimerase